ncbi:MAG: DUF255 domain-containing protein [Planctomycetia bacterium]|nr:DUF255 domain-containing protein [Planctomycetia bacterium]
MKPRLDSPRCAAFGVALLLALLPRPASAEEIQWRQDYHAARQEAKTTNRPLVMDFGTANCFWCKKLDGSTFREPAIIRQLNEQFIPLKIDAEREAQLTQQLNIRSFPTLVFAAPDGRILGKHAGFVEAAQFGQQLRRALADSRPAENAAPPAAAPPPLDRGRLAVCLLAKAQEDQRQGRFAGCLECCRVLVALYPDLPQTEDARAIIRQISADPHQGPQASAQLAEQLAGLYLEMAQAAQRQDRAALAIEYWQRVVQLTPGSALSRVAEQQLAQARPVTAANVPPTTVRGQSR